MQKFTDKTILVTGATGLIGSNLVDRLLAEGAKVIVMGRTRTKITDAFMHYLFNANFSYEVANISKGIPASIGPLDYIFHAASSISGVEIKSKPVDVINANIIGTQKCLEFLKRQKEQGNGSGKMIIFSSATVYGNNHTLCKSVSESETTLTDALYSGSIAYSESKRMVEVLATSYHMQYGIESIIARIGYVYGYTKNKPNTAFYEFIDKAINGQDIIVNTSSSAKRDNIFVDDAVNGLLAISTMGISGETYNISSNGEKDNFKAIDEIAQLITCCINNLRKDKKISLYIKENQCERKPGIMLNNTKLKKLGWSLETSLQEGIYNTLQKYMRMR